MMTRDAVIVPERNLTPEQQKLCVRRLPTHQEVTAEAQNILTTLAALGDDMEKIRVIDDMQLSAQTRAAMHAAAPKQWSTKAGCFLKAPPWHLVDEAMEALIATPHYQLALEALMAYEILGGHGEWPRKAAEFTRFTWHFEIEDAMSTPCAWRVMDHAFQDPLPSPNSEKEMLSALLLRSADTWHDLDLVPMSASNKWAEVFSAAVRALADLQVRNLGLRIARSPGDDG